MDGSKWSDDERIYIHGIDPVTMGHVFCGFAIEEWGCGYGYKAVIVDDPIDCPECISCLNLRQQFKKTKMGWV
jgi:hypothetical protein